MHYIPKPMHIPDGFLSVAVAVTLWLFSILAVGAALRRLSKERGERQAPLMGVLAAAIFAGQMLNFAVAGGASGHLMGAAIATILLGPWAAILVMTSVVSIQALIFQDGGLLALGANIFNMAIIGVAVAYFVFATAQKLSGGRRGGVLLGGFLAAWASVEVTALAVGLQLALSGASPANLVIPVMGGVHALIGLGEGLITAGALAFVSAARPDLFLPGQKSVTGSRALWAGGLLLAIVLAIAAPLASAHPDGLEWVARQQGFLLDARGPLYKLIPNYLLPGIENQAAATILAGVLGILIVSGVAVGMAYLRRRSGA